MTDLHDTLARWTVDPLAFVEQVFPWGEGSLAGRPGPHPWQRAELHAIARAIHAGLQSRPEVIRRAITSGHGVGKALAHGEPVLTPTGWRPIESLRVGDQVVAVDGRPTRVIGVFPQGERDLFRVTTDDGGSVVVDGDHQWLTSSRSERKHGKPASVRTTREIAESLTFANGPTRGLNHQLPALRPVEHSRAILPVEPYLLGCWLGDGDKVGRLTGMPDAFEALAAAGADLGQPYAKPGNQAAARTAIGIRPGLRALGLLGLGSHERFIPTVYLHAAIDQRESLLQGLLDTDGTAQKNGAVAFEVTSQQLADGVCELVRSLGGVVRRSEKVGSYNGKQCRRVYRCYISLPAGVRPFRLPRKAQRYAPQWGAKNCDRTRRRHIASVEPVGRGLATCIAVDHPSRLFVTRDHIVTHNSAIVAWIILWAMLLPETRGIVTANTETQLRTKTWAELAKWHAMLPQGWDLTELTATALLGRSSPQTWRIDAVPWSLSNTEAFAGLHNAGKRILVVYDEASAIDDRTWEVTEGALTDEDTEILWVACGNPTRSTGRFYDCGGRFRHRWAVRTVDSREVPGTNRAQIDQWVADYGEDSDFVRVRVRGLPPRASASGMFGADLVGEAMRREPHCFADDPLVMTVDVSRGGQDDSVIGFRCGMDARSVPWITIPGSEVRDSMRLVTAVTDAAVRLSPAAIIVDETGVGGPIVDRLTQLVPMPVYGINFGAKSDDPKHANMRMTMYWRLREAMQRGLAIPNDPLLERELLAIEYQHDAQDRMLLIPKDRMRKDLGFSPDRADALALSFAVQIAPAAARPVRVVGRAGRSYA
jgi:hypothetical protein